MRQLIYGRLFIAGTALAGTNDASKFDVAKWQGQGYADVSGDVIKRTKRSECMEKYQEVMD